VNIAYSCDNSYISHTGISIISLLTNNKFIDEITIYLISKGISAHNLNVIKDICAQFGRELVVVPFEDIAYDLKLTNTGRHIETVYTKIFLSRIEKLRKCLYIDSDTIVAASLESLWNTDLSGSYLAAVETISIRNKRKLEIKRESVFFNDGVTLMNLEYCRDNQLIEKCLRFIDKFEGSPPVLSEGVLSSICQDEVKIMSMRNNLMSGMYQLGIENPEYLSTITTYSKDDIIDACQHPVIIHFLSAFYNRPWSVHCSHPLKRYYLEYKEMSPWKDEKLSNLNLPFKLRVMSLFGNILSFSVILRLSRLKDVLLGTIYRL
jgi:lipopolysaccharide biosynthesis glycosyltransferase